MLHSSYSFALAFDAELVSRLLSRLPVEPPAVILDPFCGTGTTLLESKIAGFRSIGVDANPVCVMVSRAKTDWGLHADDLERALRHIVTTASRKYAACLERAEFAQRHGQRYSVLLDPLFTSSSIGRYLETSGLMRRGWICPRPALKTLLVAEEIRKLPIRQRNFLFLSLLGLLVPELSNMAYGPEIYKKRNRRDRNVVRLFEIRARENLRRLVALKAGYANPTSTVRLGSSINGGLSFILSDSIDAVISSPPYLSDHDYSRLMRLELVFTGAVSSRDDLRAVKRTFLRSSSKNVYKDDCWTQHVAHLKSVQDAISAVSDRAANKSSGFARVYPRLIGEYFGGMYEHFKALGRVLRPGGYAAYVVGDQSSFFAVPIPTARILANIAEQCEGGLEMASMEPIRQLRGTRGNVRWSNSEWLIILRKRLRKGP